MADLKVEGLSISFGGIQSLKNVSLEVGSHKFVGLMGPNGAGKTTLVNCLSRTCQPSDGKILFDGRDLSKLSGDEVLQIGISRTFQNLDFFTQFSKMEVIDYMRLGQFNPSRNWVLSDGLRIKRSRDYERELKRNARRILDFFRQLRESLEPPAEERRYPLLYGREGFPDLMDVENTPIGDLSFAWRRRLDLARALVSMPKLLLLDEPAQGLPPTEMDNLGRVLQHIRSEFGISALIIEHNIDMLMNISDHVAVMNAGELIVEGKPDAIRKNEQVIELYLGMPKSDSADAPIEIGKARAPQTKQKTEPLLQVKGLDVFYGTAQALFSVSINVYPGQIATVLGVNGSGKSTLLRAISGVEKPAFGEILFKGSPLPLGIPEAAVERGIQYVPQGHVIFPELTVRDNLKIGSYIFEKKGVKFSDGLEKVCYYFPMLKDHLKSQAASLSGGQQQMLAISQAVMGKPDLLLLDEPSLGLSPIMVDTLFNTIVKMNVEENFAVALIEQNVNKALEISDYVFMLNSGVLMGEGTSSDLKKNGDTIKRYLGFR